MQIKLLAKDLSITPAFEQFVDEKIGSLEKFLSRYEEENEVIARVEVARDNKHHHKGLVFYAEINLHLPGKELRADAHAEDARAAVVKVKDVLKNEIVRYKEMQLNK